MAGYKEAIEVAIGKEMETLGKEKAIEIARDTSDLSVDEDGNVLQVNGSGKDVLSGLVESYTDVTGPVASSLIAYELRDEVDTEGIELPDNLSEHL
ncbi:MAG: hypothetical protein ABEK01_05670 [Candidatus Nanohaloarchaea archaeon]